MIRLAIPTRKFAMLLSVLFISACSTCPQTTISAQWESICSHDGCLMGSQHWYPEEAIWGISIGYSEGSSISPCWRDFLNQDRSILLPFLFGKLQSTRATASHTDPFQGTLEGEMAVYALEQLSHKNWFDYSGNNKKIRAALKEIETRNNAPIEEYENYSNNQFLLWDLLQEEDVRKEFEVYFSSQ